MVDKDLVLINQFCYIIKRINMAVAIRLTRLGKHKQPYYRIVAVDSRKPRDGKYIELVGTFNPLKNEINIDKEIAIKWLNNGAKPSETVRELFSKQHIMKSFHETKQKSK